MPDGLTHPFECGLVSDNSFMLRTVKSEFGKNSECQISNDLGGDSRSTNPDRHLLATWPTVVRRGLVD